jgi:protein TonB
MEYAIKKTAVFPLSILFAMIVTASLFVTLPLLTQLKPTSHTQTNTQPVLIPYTKPSPPPSEERDEVTKQTPMEREIVREETRTKRVPQLVGLPRGDAAIGPGVIKIDVTPRIEAFPITAPPTYTPDEVDQPPGVLRAFPLQYPYLAQRDNVEGWVMLGFTVDTEGVAKDIEVVASEPAGVFEKAALKAVARYKFKPATKDGEAVSCRIKQRILFELD